MTRHQRKHIPFGADNFLSILEGIEGGFAIFAGIVVGLYFQNVSRELLITTAIISLVVSAFNSSAVRYSTEHYMDELDGHEKRDKVKAYFIPSLIEFATYALVSLIAATPLLIVQDTFTAIVLTCLTTILLLFTAGWYRGRLFGHHAVRDGFELAGLGAAIIIIGMVSGWILANIVA